MLQWTKHNCDGQGRYKWGGKTQMYRRLDRDRNRQTQRAWNHMSVSIFVCQLCFEMKWEVTFKCSCLYPSSVAPYSVGLLGKRQEVSILHRRPILIGSRWKPLLCFCVVKCHSQSTVYKLPVIDWRPVVVGKWYRRWSMNKFIIYSLNNLYLTIQSLQYIIFVWQFIIHSV